MGSSAPLRILDNGSGICISGLKTTRAGVWSFFFTGTMLETFETRKKKN